MSTSSHKEPGDHFERRTHRPQAPPWFDLEPFDEEVPTLVFETTSLALILAHGASGAKVADDNSMATSKKSERVVGSWGFEYDVPCRSA